MSNAIREVRESLGLSQRQFADRLSWTQPHICLYEQEKSRLSGDRAFQFYRKYRRRLANLGFSCEDILAIGRR